MGRSPCCEKVGLKKGPWTPEEDQKLLAYIEEHGHGSWRALPGKAGLQRCGKSCRLRWTNYLRPDIKRGKFSLQEEQTIIQLHALLGNRWSAIATHLPKRTDNEIKNYWNTHLKKRLAKMGIDPVTHKPKSDALGSADGGHSKSVANLSHMAQWESARLEAEARLVRESKLRSPAASTVVPFHHQLISGPTSSVSVSVSVQQLHAKSPPPCLDVLRAWQGVWSKSTTHAGQGGGSSIDQESPTSTLSFSDQNMLPIAAAAAASVDNNNNNSAAMCHHHDQVEVGEDEVDWKWFGKPMPAVFDTKEIRMENLTPGFPLMEPAVVFGTEAPWVSESSSRIVTGSSGGGGGEFRDGFTGLLLENSGDQNSSDGGGGGCDSDNVQGGGGGGCEEQDQEENKNYWNSLLSLVGSSSPSNSPPVF